ncbi:MAG: helix-turn-helix domain-containing protein [Lachnospiraceae bacterium]|nr:helix-turn-helix domain-containing protein [Lachnospiraceae bacterium]
MAVNCTKKDIILKNMDNIKEWLSQGVSMTAIAKSLGVSKTTLYKYCGEKLEVNGSNGLDAIKKAREPAVKQLENAMFNSALGGKVQVREFVKLKNIEYNENGKKAREWEELREVVVEKFITPDTTAGIFLLKNWGNYMNEPRAMEFRAKELELKEKQVDANTW